MIERYTLPEMAAIWSREAKCRTWLDVELAVMEAQESVGLVPPGTTEAVKSKATFNLAEIDAIEMEVKHDVIAFLTNVGQSVGELSRFIHLGMTSSDLVDTAFSLQMQQAGQLILEALQQFRDTLFQRAQEHRHTVMVGRSHGIHGEPITFGLKVLVWVEEMDRHLERFRLALEENRVGQVSGAMGTYAHMPPEIEAAACKRLNLKPVPISTQVIGRDRHASYMVALAQIASSLEKIAVEIRNLQRTDVLEVEEPFTKGQKGSSAMPHKRNPVSSENITGLARLVRSYALPVLENVALWHERDISHSAVERVVFPDACILIHYMLHRYNGVMAGLVVYPENMKRNMEIDGGVIFSQRVLLALIDTGMSREDAYRLVQRNAHGAWNHPGGNFKKNLLEDSEVTAALSSERVEECFDAKAYLTHVDTIFERFGRAMASVGVTH